VRAGHRGFAARTQTSIAVSADGRAWTVLDASPDLRAQISNAAALQPRVNDPPRSSPIKAVALTGCEIDQVAGLPSLREADVLQLLATDFVLESLLESTVFDALTPQAVTRHAIEVGKPFEPFDGAGISLTAIPVAGKIPLHLRPSQNDRHWRGDETIGFVLEDEASGRRAAYVPACASVTDTLRSALSGIDTLLFDGTLYSDDEMVEQRLSSKTGASMGHMCMSGAGGSIESLHDVAIARRIFIHLNNSNPVLDENSRERHAVISAGWEVAADGMELRL
jgi:pyrroloquinoline quinone biosynthesis protein B